MPEAVKAEDLERRFWERVYVGGEDECWGWALSVDSGGYGQFCVGGGRIVAAHRFSWELANGEIPEGKWVLHTCDVPYCVNPFHLVLGTALEDSVHMRTRGRGHNQGGSGRGVLTPGAVQEILRLRKAGMPMRAIAKRHGITEATANNVVRGRIWGHVGAAREPGRTGAPYKLLEGEVTEARFLLALGVTRTRVAAGFGVQEGVIGLLARGVTYRGIGVRPRLGTLPESGSPEELEEMQRRHQLGVGSARLGRDFGYTERQARTLLEKAAPGPLADSC